MAQAAIKDEPYFEPDPAPACGRAMSIEEWEAMDEDEPGELVDGVLEEDELVDSTHELAVSSLLFAIGLWARGSDAVVLGSGALYALDDKTGRKADISVLLGRDRKLARRGANRHPPDIMVEVFSPRPRDHRRDRVQKLREYAAFGVRWYWLVDPEARTLSILRLRDDGHYAHALDADEGIVNVPGCEGLTLDLDALWREVDDWIEPEEEPAQS